MDMDRTTPDETDVMIASRRWPGEYVAADWHPVTATTDAASPIIYWRRYLPVGRQYLMTTQIKGDGERAWEWAWFKEPGRLITSDRAPTLREACTTADQTVSKTIENGSGS